MNGDEDKEEDERLNINWGTDTCDICCEEMWLTMVLYEPVRTPLEEVDTGQATFSRHPAPSDEEVIAVCNQCLRESLEKLADLNEVNETDVPFDQVRKYLIYEMYPEYAERVFPDEARSFDRLSQG